MTIDRKSFRVHMYGCNHMIEFAMARPDPGDIITCYLCKRGRVVASVGVMCWTMTCTGCDWAHTTGMKGGEAHKKSQIHTNKTHHPVEIRNPKGVLVETTQYTGIQDLLPGV